MEQKQDIVLYQIDNANVCVSVFYKDETFWLTRMSMAELFGVRPQAISKHLGNIYKEDELDRESTSSKMELVQNEGGVEKKRDVDFYNLDAIIAVGYRVNSMSRLNRLVTMFIDYAELMAEDEVLMSMQDWVDQTNRFLSNNRRKVLEGKGRISHEQAVEKAAKEYDIFRVRQDQEYISEFDKQTEKYFKGE